MPLTLSLISTHTSPSLKLFTSDFPRDTPRNLHISTARLIFEFPAKILILSSMFGPRQPCCRCIYADTVGLLHTLAGAGRIRTSECRNQNPVSYRLTTPPCDLRF